MLPNVFLSDVEAIWWSILSLYALISLLCVRVCVCVCVCVCLWVCDLVTTSQLNLLKIYVHPALPPPAPPQALNVPTTLRSISHVSVLYSSKRGRAIFFIISADLACYFRSAECSFLAWLRCEGYREGKREGERLNLSPPAGSRRVRYLCRAVASRWAELGDIAQCSASRSRRHEISEWFPLCDRWERIGLVDSTFLS